IDLEGRPVAGAVVRLRELERQKGDAPLDAWLAAFARWRKEARGRGVPPYDNFEGISIESFAPGTTKTGKDGKFRLAGFGREGLVGLTVEAPGREGLMVSVATRARVDASVGGWYRPATFTETLGPGKVMVITATDRRTGKPATGVPFHNVGTTGTSDANGKCRLEGLAKRKQYYLGWGGFSSPDFFLLKPGADTPRLDEDKVGRDA